MNMKWILAVALGMILTSDAALAGDKKKNKGERVKGERGWETRFDRIDANDDGSISKGEFQAFRAEKKAARKERKGKV